MLLLRRGVTRPRAVTASLASSAQLLVRSRGFRAPSAFELFKPAWLSRLTDPVSAAPPPPSHPLTDPLPVAEPRPASPPDGPLSDQDFYRLPALEQTRHALSCPVPTTLPAIREPRLAAVIFGGDALKKLSKEERNAFYSAYHPERLEFVGDRLWYNIIAETIFILSPVEPLVPPVNPTLKNFQSTIMVLATNDLGAKLAKELGLSKEPLTNVYSIKRAADSFETYLAALLYSNGRRALLEFLVPLVKREYFRLPQHRYDALPPLRTDKESTTSEPPPGPVSPPAPSPSPTTTVPASSSSSSTPPPPPSVAPPPATARSSVDPSPAAPKASSANSTTPKRPPSEPVFRFAEESEACQQILGALHTAGLSKYLRCYVNASVPGGGRSTGLGTTFEQAWLSMTAKVIKLPTVIVIDKKLKKPLLSSFPLRYPTIDAKRIAGDLQQLAPKGVKEIPSRVIWSIELCLPDRENIRLEGNYTTYGNAVQKFVQRCISRGVIKLGSDGKLVSPSPKPLPCPPSSPIDDISAPGDPAASASAPVDLSTSLPDTKVAVPTPASSAATSSSAEQSEKAGILLTSNSQFRRLKRMKKMDPIVVKSAEGLEDVLLDMLDKRGVPFSCYASFNQTYVLRLPGRPVITAGSRGDFAPVIQCALRAQVIQVASSSASTSTIAQQVKAAQDFSPSKLNTQSRMEPLLVVSLEGLEDHLLRSLDESGVNFKARSVPHTTHYSLALPGVLPVECGSKKQGFRPVVDRLVQLQLVKLVGSSPSTCPDSPPASSLSIPTDPPPSSALSNPSLPSAPPSSSPPSTAEPSSQLRASASPSPLPSSPPPPPSSDSPSTSPSSPSPSPSSPPASSAWEGDYFKLLDKLQITGEDELVKGKKKAGGASKKKVVEAAKKNVEEGTQRNDQME